MIIPSLQALFRRDLDRLRKEISLYKNEEIIWATQPDIANSAGNLCLHLVGNLNTYIGGELGKTGYVRDREAEFSLRGIAQQELIAMVEQTKAVVDSALASVRDDQLAEEYPLLVFTEKTSTGLFLIHLSGHLNYHLGQINYHRRLLDR